MNKLMRLFHTLRYLKLKQIYYRIYYIVRQKVRKLTHFQYKVKKTPKQYELFFEESIFLGESYKHGTFTFLNITHDFKSQIDWNYLEYGKLWTYNLNYFDFLNQEKIDNEEAINLIYDFIKKMPHINDGLMPFPISLRGINWIKYLSNQKINDEKIITALYLQYQILMDNLEYHILGNHLLENGFSLLFGAYYFHDEKLYAKAYEILTNELQEQVLKDGAHFELSPMYHQIMLFRVLDCINLAKNNPWKRDGLLFLLEEKASMMLGWLVRITFKNGNIPLFNDSTNKIAPRTFELMEYAQELKIDITLTTLSDSGYRKIKNEFYECVIDVGNIGPDYIPGHAHSDTFSFELYIDGQPVIVDTGISTYETNRRRMLERSTSAHNTVEINAQNQSHVWGGFRVAERAKVISLEENKGIISAIHNGYEKMGFYHKRNWKFLENEIQIIDEIIGINPKQVTSYLHFHPDIIPILRGKEIIMNKGKIVLNTENIRMEEYDYTLEFNKTVKGIKIAIDFDTELIMEIIL